MNKVPAKGQTTKGIDVSRWQKPLYWASEKSQGIAFMFAKVSEGMGADPGFVGHVKGARDQGILTGGYHFFHPLRDPKAQAQWFVESAAKIGRFKLDLPLAMDWETTDGAPAQSDRESGLAFLLEVERLTSRVPMIYTGPYFAQSLALDQRFTKYPLWVAHYGVSAPLIPDPWRDWVMWQVSGTGLDHDVYNGSEADLRALKGLA